MGAYEVFDSKFRSLIDENAPVRKLFGGSLWAEGPVYFRDGRFLLWSDIPNNRVLRWVDGLGVDEFRNPSNFTNGNTRDLSGRLISCEHGERRVTRTEPTGEITVLADRFRGKRLNSPNDVVVKSDGSIWFTDPDYGILSDFEGHKAESEVGACNVYRVDPHSAEVTAAATDFDKPNGIAFSPDESLLYISDTGVSHRDGGPHHIRVFEVGADGALSGGGVFAEVVPGVSDGFRMDRDANLWTSAGDGIHCYDPSGALLGKVLIPETVANLTFGGAEGNLLFIAASSSLYVVKLRARGAQQP
ncbi:MAG TPA: SMP-30/gluconolactonase/LRE family protein [Spirochaetia bacterium]|nr:SMP-30/gluconolactonase/LRE family protein [Spirochaetia bacterium]